MAVPANSLCSYVSVGKSALHWAAAVNNVDAAVVLLKNGANKDLQNNKVGLCISVNEFIIKNDNCYFLFQIKNVFCSGVILVLFIYSL